MEDIKARLMASTDVQALDADSWDGFSFFRNVWKIVEPVLSGLNVQALDQSQREALFGQIRDWYFWAAEKVDIPRVPEFIEKVAERRIWKMFLAPTLSEYLGLD